MRGPVDKRYARALLEIGVAQSRVDVMHTQVTQIGKLYSSSSDLRAIVTNPSVGVDERRRVITEVAERAGWDPMVRNFALLLLDNDRFDHVEGIAAELDDLVDAHAGNVRAHVTTASALDDAQVSTIKAAIGRLTGKKVLLETSVDPEVLGGVVTRVGTTLYDGSVRSQLQALRGTLLDD